MTTPDLLQVRLALPCAWQRQELDDAATDALWHEARLILTLAQHEAASPPRDGERDGQLERGLGRLEAKLDLAMHLLVRTLRAGTPPGAPIPLTLLHGGLLLPPGLATAPAERGCCLLGLNPRLPLPVRLPAEVARLDGQVAELRWLAMPEDLAELWSQWLFRQHRRAIHARQDQHSGDPRQQTD